MFCFGQREWGFACKMARWRVTIRRYAAAPLTRHWPRYLSHRADQGTEPHLYLLRRIAIAQLVIAEGLGLVLPCEVGLWKVEAWVERWTRNASARRGGKTGRVSRRLVPPVVGWLHFTGRMAGVPEARFGPHHDRINAFADIMRHECGWPEKPTWSYARLTSWN